MTSAPTIAGSSGEWRPSASFELLQLRAELLARARTHFATTRALEIETPALVRATVSDVHLESFRVVDDSAGGATVGFLQTSPEYAMKRLLSAGTGDIYQVCRVYRGGERGRRHNPEFTMIEWYRRGFDHHALMRDVETLVLSLLSGHRTAQPSVKLSYRDAFEQALQVDPLRADAGEIAMAVERRGTAVPASVGTGNSRDEILDFALATVVAESFARDRLTFLHDYPASQAALARTLGDGQVAARFEAFWGPLELANGFDELTDAAEQRSRFEADLGARRARQRPARELDERFLAALAAGLPPCAGVALGFDRLMMVASGCEHIDDVIAFPYERA